MKFYPEDEILTAEEAKERALVGYEDSIDREFIRSLMKIIKNSSFYGYRSAHMFGRYHKMSDNVKSALVDLGYRFQEIETSRAPGLKPLYQVVVEW